MKKLNIATSALLSTLILLGTGLSSASAATQAGASPLTRDLSQQEMSTVVGKGKITILNRGKRKIWTSMSYRAKHDRKMHKEVYHHNGGWMPPGHHQHGKHHVIPRSGIFTMCYTPGYQWGRATQMPATGNYRRICK